jgi:hypothetical protein
MNINIWIVLTETAKDTLRPLLDDPTYDGPHLTAVKIFRRMIDIATVERMFKSPTLGGTKYFLYSVTFNDIGGGGAQKLQDALEYLEANYPAQFEVVGAWLWDGRQVGTQWVDPEDHSQGTTGTPLYPIHPQLIQFMPDVGGAPATELADVNLVQGQSPRQFT